jgi:penicillin amidase
MQNRLLTILIVTVLSTSISAQIEQQSFAPFGLQDSAEILTDKWGVPHIYAKSQYDLFFAQGFYAAKDRLFQFEIWRRQALGTVAELLGPRELKRDIGTRLFKFRGDINEELSHYHKDGIEIINAFVDGVNAYIEETRKNPDLLPMEFGLLQTVPELWTPEVVISRHQGLLGNIGLELATGRLVEAVGVKMARELTFFHPKEPILDIDPNIDGALLNDDILELYNAYRRPVRFHPDDLISDAKADYDDYRNLADSWEADWEQVQREMLDAIGSNNWIVDGKHTTTGYPIMANDPHRTLASPSLRYMAHLVAPGWNVIGGGEPEIPGISIGHNEEGSWGLTVYRTDAEDLYVYNVNPENPNEYNYQGEWEEMILIDDEIPVKGNSPSKVTYKYTRHGPVVFEDAEHNVAYAVRCGWLEVGGSPYLASLRMDQSKTFKEFRDACSFSHIPGENMVWADRSGNIGWQAVGIAPVRNGWSGLVPVPGDGTYEWDGYLAIKKKPNLSKPKSGHFSTANQSVTPDDYKHWNAVGYNWSDAYRGDRLEEMLGSKKKHSMEDMESYQTDYLSLPARELVPYAERFVIPEDQEVMQSAREAMLNWDYMLEPNSVAASIYVAWEQELRIGFKEFKVPEHARKFVTPQMSRIVQWIHEAMTQDEKNDERGLVLFAFNQGVKKLEEKFGTDISQWQYGTVNHKHVLIRHPLTAAVNDSLRAILDVGPVGRGGNAYVVCNTSNNMNQTAGATFRIIVDTGDWDNSVAMNSPGQSGDPEDPLYRNLFVDWSKNKFFPLAYSRSLVEDVTYKKLLLLPAAGK